MSDIKAVLNSDTTIKAVMNSDHTLKGILNSGATLKGVVNTSLTVNKIIDGGNYIHFNVTQEGTGQVFTSEDLLQYNDVTSINLMKNGVYIDPTYYTKPSGDSIQINIYLDIGDEIDILATGSSIPVPTAPGTDRDVLFNNAGVISGSTNFKFDGSNVTISGTYIGSINGSNVVGNVAAADVAYSVAAANVVGTVPTASIAYSVSGANVSGTVNLANSATTAGTVTSNSQPNITSVGTLTTLTVSGMSSVKEVKETFVADSTAPTGTVNLDVLNSAILYKTTNATANFTLNIRGNSSTTLNSVLNTGESISVTLVYSVGTTSYAPTTIQIDGSAKTVKYPSGVQPLPVVSSTAVITFSILKTNANTYTILGNYGSFL